jgi:hypothetical protein
LCGKETKFSDLTFPKPLHIANRLAFLEFVSQHVSIDNAQDPDYSPKPKAKRQNKRRDN